VPEHGEQEDTGARIRSAALRLFSGRGFHGTGIRDLAQGAGTSSSTLYHYMGSKEDLLMEVMTESMSMLTSAARHSVEGRDAAIVVDNELENLLPADRDILMQERDDYEALWADALERGIVNGDFRIGRPRMARLALIQMCTGVAYWYSPEGDSTLEEIGDYFAELGLQLAGASVTSTTAKPKSKRPRKPRPSGR
jgi:AcrR family transcriptional regulator